MQKQQTAERYRMRGFFVALVLLIFGFADSAYGQHSTASTPEFEVAGAYSYIRANAAESGGGFNLNGASASFAYNFNDSFSVLGDLGAYRFGGLPSGVSSNMYTYLFGPRFSFHRFHRATPFVQGLLGGGHLMASSGSVDASENGFALALGGGLDVPFHRHFAIRVIQAEYLMTRFATISGTTVTQNNLRVSAGLVFRFGKK